MCTVTFIPTKKGVHLTSSRDEHHKRSKALPPQSYYGPGGTEIIFPKDPDAGGTWIALRNRKDAVVLLNGSFQKHTPAPPYRKSRGIILLELLAYSDLVNGFNSLALAGIEPFTLILFSENKLSECRWDGSEKHQRILNANMPQIWSSVTLYEESTIKQREDWFKKWQVENGAVSTEAILKFHQFAGAGDPRNSVLMNRDNVMSTVSITSLFIGIDQSHICYMDLQNDTIFQNTLPHNISPSAKETAMERLLARLKHVLIRAKNWEYWPSYLIYAPVYFYWLWLSLKARSLFFFSAANPSIRHSGFAQERKSDIYHLIPQQYYPNTLLCRPRTNGPDLRSALQTKSINFPLIAKPDIGERGIQVALLHTQIELEQYSHKSKVDFLIQEYIPYDLEAGIFYYRIPGEPKGHISGIVGKEFLSVTGDGRSTIEDLLKKTDRSFLQLQVLKSNCGTLLNRVLPMHEKKVLVPYGNHSRGSRFIDESWRITDKLVDAIDHVCQQIPEFYYGRLDIKFKSWDALKEGREFSIIELNGAGSEPTHIYDPNHSILFAWKEICFHWNLLSKISRMNAKQKGLRLMTFSDGIRMKQDRSHYLKLITQ